MVTLNDLINWGSQKLIESVLIEFGEEIHATKISEAIVKYRQNYGSIKSTKILSKIIEDVVPIKFIGKKTFYSNPCTRSFQAFRIKINDELKVLKEGLDSAVASLSENGHIAVVTFHALEDRIVKVFMKNHVNSKFLLKFKFK